MKWIVVEPSFAYRESEFWISSWGLAVMCFFLTVCIFGDVPRSFVSQGFKQSQHATLTTNPWMMPFFLGAAKTRQLACFPPPRRSEHSMEAVVSFFLCEKRNFLLWKALRSLILRCCICSLSVTFAKAIVLHSWSVCLETVFELTFNRWILSKTIGKWSEESCWSFAWATPVCCSGKSLASGKGWIQKMKHFSFVQLSNVRVYAKQHKQQNS